MSGEQEPAQHGLEKRRFDIGAGSRSDRGGRRVSLLCGKAALLDGEGGSVSRGLDPVVADHTAMRIGGDEPAYRLREAADGGPAHCRERDGAIRLYHRG